MSRTHEYTTAGGGTRRPPAGRVGRSRRRSAIPTTRGLAGASHAELVALAAGGDQRAWAELVARFDPMVRGVAGQGGCGYGDAADIAQETWLRLVEHIGDLQDPECLPGWLKTTTSREARNFVTRSSRQIPCAELSEAPAAGTADDVDRRLDAPATNQVLQRALSHLSIRQRRLLTLLMSDEDPSYLEVSARLGIAVGSIGPTRDRSLAKLRRTSPLLAAALR
ncbi:MAG: RNA polymerase sigma factor [Acidimicrobiales bacterium]